MKHDLKIYVPVFMPPFSPWTRDVMES